MGYSKKKKINKIHNCLLQFLLIKICLFICLFFDWISAPEQPQMLHSGQMPTITACFILSELDFTHLLFEVV